MNDDLMENNNKSQVVQSTKTRMESVRKKVKWTIIRTVAILFWTYAILKLFILDFDVLLINNFFPDAIWLIRYRWVATLTIITMIAIAFWKRNLIGPILYLIFFPFIVVFFHVPSWLIHRRAWTLSIALLASTMTAIKSLRSTIIFFALFIFGLLFISVASADWVLQLGIGFLFIFIIIIYFRTIREAFRSSLDIFSPRSLDKLWSQLNKGFSDQVQNPDVQTMTESQKSFWISHLQFNVVFNRVCYFIADKITSLRQGRILAAIAGVRIAWLFTATLIVFTILNIGLYKLDPTQFEVTGTARWFDFLWYTFQATFVNNVSELTPIGDFARALFIVNGITIGLLLFVIIVFFVTGVQIARNSDEIDNLTESIKQQGRNVEAFVLDAFGLTIAAAVKELVEMKAILADWIVQISPDIDRKSIE